MLRNPLAEAIFAAHRQVPAEQAEDAWKELTDEARRSWSDAANAAKAHLEKHGMLVYST